MNNIKILKQKFKTKMKKIKKSKSLHLVHEISLTLEFCVFELAYLLKL